ncbi:hypothetical protein NZK35_02990 [Stieleria sp. ICT_E10.1]|uniref:hypothetical protein n=1 Tax=Stieleria sedimenti TaxID=2976331 RepID=UPI0021805857|nr:hypothetical protein [Stieleria sedimenti]MCS7465637.1 hypothetical protein [Stieleria sedimenti]
MIDATNMLKYLLIPLGILSAIILAVPNLVVLGYFFLVIPGLILTIIPTVFVYLFATFLIRPFVPSSSRVGASVIAFGMAIALGFLVMLPWRMIEVRRFEQAALPDIAASPAIRLTGNVLVDFPPNPRRSASALTCDHRCTALLDTPGVESVTKVCGDDAATFRRGPNAAGTLAQPDQPQKILDAFDRLSGTRGMRRFEERRRLDRALQADWALRIAQGDTLREHAPLGAKHIDWRVIYQVDRRRGEPRVERLEIRDHTDAVMARKSLVKHRIPSPFFYFGFEGAMTNARFTVGGSNDSNQTRYYDFDPDVELLRLTQIRQPNPAPDSVERMQQKLAETLDDPNATDAQLLLAPLWLRLFQYEAGQDQIDTIAKILLDERIADPHQLLRTTLRSKTDLTALRMGLAKRFLAADEPQARTWYVSALVGLPTATFAQPSNDEQAIWDRATSVQEAAPFLERLADQGTAVVPELLGILDQVVEKPWHERFRVVRGIREAFKRMGPDAAMAIPRIRSLLAERRSPLTNSADDRLQWLVALARMGVPVEELPYGSWVTGPSELQRHSTRVRNQLKRYEAECSISVHRDGATSGSSNA